MNRPQSSTRLEIGQEQCNIWQGQWHKKCHIYDQNDTRESNTNAGGYFRDYEKKTRIW